MGQLDARLSTHTHALGQQQQRCSGVLGSHRCYTEAISGERKEGSWGVGTRQVVEKGGHAEGDSLAQSSEG